MAPRDRLMAAINHQEVFPVPYEIWFLEGIAERMDQHYGNKEWRSQWNPTFVSCSPVQLVNRRTLPDDPTRQVDMFGGIWRIDGLADHLEQPGMPEADLSLLRLPDLASLRNPSHLAQCRKQLAASPDRAAVASVWGSGLYETLWNLRGFEGSLFDAAGDEDFYGELITRVAQFVEAILDLALELPVDIINFGDDLGDQCGVTVGPDRWRRFYKPHWARFCSKAHAAGKKVFLHSCGSVASIMPDLIEVGIDILDPIQPEAAGMNPYELKRKYGDRITLCGGLGSQSTIPFGSPSSIRTEIFRLVHEVGHGGGYILKPAKSIRNETPLENAIAVFEAFTQQESL